MAYIFGIALLASPGNSLHAVIILLAIYLVVFGGPTMLAKGRSVRAGLLVAALFPVLGQIALFGLATHRR